MQGGGGKSGGVPQSPKARDLKDAFKKKLENLVKDGTKYASLTPKDKAFLAKSYNSYLGLGSKSKINDPAAQAKRKLASQVNEVTFGNWKKTLKGKVAEMSKQISAYGKQVAG